MSNREMLEEFINDEFFGSSLVLSSKTVTYLQGREVVGASVDATITGVIQPVSAKELINLGLGKFTDKLNFSLHTATEIEQSENNFITFKGKTYRIISTLPWTDYGFNNYIISQYNEDTLNDN